MANKLKMRLHEDATWMEVSDVLADNEYTPAEDVKSTKQLCAYKEFSTGVETPKTATVLINYYDEGQLSVEVVADTYERACKGGMSKDPFYTFIQNDAIRVASKETMERAVRFGERAMEFYIKALQAVQEG